jgi:kynureninase
MLMARVYRLTEEEQAQFKFQFMFESSLSFAYQLDKDDPLAKYRSNFIIPLHEGSEAIYFLGNSLGLQPKTTNQYIKTVLEQWAQFGVEAFFLSDQPWLKYHDQLVGPLSAIVGSLPHEVVVMNQLTVNLHLMLASFYQPTKTRNKIICEAKAFPSDQYMLETHIRQRGLDPDDIIIEVNPPDGENLIDEEDIRKTIKLYENEVSLVFWGGVNYYTGQVFNMSKITTWAHDAGARVGFDLAHAAGNIKLDLHDWDVDFACWCSYKYLNSGPGAIGGAFIHEKFHKDKSLQRLGGWWGQNKERRFLMEKEFDPIDNAEGWQLSTPSPILYASHKAALDIFNEAGMEAIAEKGQLMSDYTFYLINEINKCGNEVVKIITPAIRKKKGCQLSLVMKNNGKRVFDQLTNKGVFADWREPDVIRIAPVPLYNTFEEIWRFATLLKECLN